MVSGRVLPSSRASPVFLSRYLRLMRFTTASATRTSIPSPPMLYTSVTCGQAPTRQGRQLNYMWVGRSGQALANVGVWGQQWAGVAAET